MTVPVAIPHKSRDCLAYALDSVACTWSRSDCCSSHTLQNYSEQCQYVLKIISAAILWEVHVVQNSQISTCTWQERWSSPVWTSGFFFSKKKLNGGSTVTWNIHNWRCCERGTHQLPGQKSSFGWHQEKSWSWWASCCFEPPTTLEGDKSMKPTKSTTKKSQ